MHKSQPSRRISKAALPDDAGAGLGSQALLVSRTTSGEGPCQDAGPGHRQATDATWNVHPEGGPWPPPCPHCLRGTPRWAATVLLLTWPPAIGKRQRAPIYHRHLQTSQVLRPQLQGQQGRELHCGERPPGTLLQSLQRWAVPGGPRGRVQTARTACRIEGMEGELPREATALLSTSKLWQGRRQILQETSKLGAQHSGREGSCTLEGAAVQEQEAPDGTRPRLDESHKLRDTGKRQSLHFHFLPKLSRIKPGETQAPAPIPAQPGSIV